MGHVTEALANPVFADSANATGFAGTIEGFAHGSPHVWVGGAMGDPDHSPTDPLFYLHHCNIDRLWAIWQQNHPDAVQYPEDQVDHFVPGTTTKVSTVLDHTHLDYLYPVDARLEAAWREHRETQTNDLDTTPPAPTLYGNQNTKELHTVDCRFFAQLVNRRPFNSVQEALNAGYNGCYWCLPEHNTG